MFAAQGVQPASLLFIPESEPYLPAAHGLQIAAPGAPKAALYLPRTQARQAAEAVVCFGWVP